LAGENETRAKGIFHGPSRSIHRHGNHGPHGRAAGRSSRWTVRRNQGTARGYYILDCKDLDEALSWAAKIPTAARAARLHRDPPNDALPASSQPARALMQDAGASVEAVFRREHGRIIASLIRLCGSFDRAEGGDAGGLGGGARALAPPGIPGNPAAWIMTAAHRKLIDMARRERTRSENAAFGAGRGGRGL